MRSRQQLENRVAEIEGDTRYRLPNATIQVNAPLALIQIELKSRRSALLWALEQPGKAAAAPFRAVARVDDGISRGFVVESLECGHELSRKRSQPTAYRRRCRDCLREGRK